MAAIFAGVLFYLHCFLGNFETAFLWVGAAMFGIFFAVFVVVASAPPEQTDHDSGDDNGGG